MLQKPFLALCTNRNTRPQSNIVAGSPEDWFNNQVLRVQNLIGFTFDFFVNWTTHQITPVFWVKRILDVHPAALLTAGGQINSDLISQKIIECDGLDFLKMQAKFCAGKHVTLQYILFREVNWTQAPENLFVVTVSLVSDTLQFNVEHIDLPQLQHRIRQFSGGPIKIGLKGLIYGTSMLECHLSKTDSLYPGDVDMIVVDATTLEIKSILEFKKHNLTTSIDNEKLGNYYPYPDQRKYDRLAILKNFLMPADKLICVYYPTKFNDFGKAEIITGVAGQLKAGGTKKIPLPRRNDEATFGNFVKEVLSL